MWERVCEAMARGAVQKGRLEIGYPSGTIGRHGPGSERGGGPDVRIDIADRATLRRIVLTPELALGEAYMNGTLTIANDDVDGLLALLAINTAHARHTWWRRVALQVRRLRRRVDQWNPAHRARQNVAHHYDLSAELYDLFLDADRQYSCAYFTHPDASLEEAQAAKKAHIAAKLRLEPGMEVLDIGCGWGGLALTLARDYGVRVLGVTLSEEQHRIATARAAEAGLSGRVAFELKDYRQVTRTFDRIVSVGMFEHVGAPHYGEYFAHVHAKLKQGGIALIHTIGRSTPPGSTSPWITKYIFPGGYVPAMSEMLAAIEPTGLAATDVEVWRLH
ncbi:MAG: cyclopropane-fatty-acyl-phospholipid synthase family protein, partial [Pseudomonadota bacterium]